MELEPHILALIGAATAAAGVGLVILSANAAGNRRSAGTAESLLAPTLAVDTLDPDLRVAYMRTLVLDARLQTRDGTPTALGREFRRGLVLLQARRHAAIECERADDLLDVVNLACDAAELETPTPDDRARWLAHAREIRASLQGETDR